MKYSVTVRIMPSLTGPGGADLHSNHFGVEAEKGDCGFKTSLGNLMRSYFKIESRGVE